MVRSILALACVAAMGLLIQSGAMAGAKDGKIRWTHKKTGACKTMDPIGVPGAQNGQPGKVELKVVYEGGKLAEFSLIGDGDSDLDVVVYDKDNNIVAKDVDPSAAEGGGSDICVCRWMPKETAEFRILIINNDPVANIAQAATN